MGKAGSPEKRALEDNGGVVWFANAERASERTCERHLHGVPNLVPILLVTGGETGFTFIDAMVLTIHASGE